MVFEKRGASRKYFDSIVFLASAVLKNDVTRLSMRYIHVMTIDDVVYMAATNGRVLHTVEYKKIDAPLEDGVYEIKVSKKDLIVLDRNGDEPSFMHWRKVLPVDNIKVINDFQLLSLNRKGDYSFCKLVFILSNLGYCIDHKYLYSLAEMGLFWDIWLNPHKQWSAVKFTSGNHTVVMMPLSVEVHKEIMSVAKGAFDLLDGTLKEVSGNTELFPELVMRKKKFLWE